MSDKPVIRELYRRSTPGLLDKLSIASQDNAAKGSRQNSCVTLENTVAPMIWDLSVLS